MNYLLLLVPPIVFGFAAYFIAKAATGGAAAWAEKRGVLDEPNVRSNHEAPTPRLGGVGLLAGLLVPLAVFVPLYGVIQGLMRYTVIDETQWLAWGGFAAACLIAFAVGVTDDFRPLPPLVKLGGQCIAAAVAAACGLAVRQLHLPFLEPIMLPAPVGMALAFVWVLLVINAVNFMDGVNGLAGRAGSVFGIFLIGCGLNRSWSIEITVLGGILFGACNGFLTHNYPRARTFLGDGGSHLLGAALAGGVLLLVNNDLHSTWTFTSGGTVPLFDPFLAGVIALSPLLFDVLYTLAWRTRRGANPLQPHREHLYQRFHRATGCDHQRTTESFAVAVYIAAGIGFLYVRFSGPGDPVWRVLLIAAAAGTLGWWWREVRRAEA
ncbi:MAG: UDP-GlcNAc:undecaprenyl-phosphate/decaprenyl-phosphate GlcNAc-phosphate transferase [Candidatus Sumerlaeota bacterium]|nr:UDP-GlcNAc:undecaprenyl-phosphate/decaprenyl-phosphate GlcNAc-phosphate transferase [Candidatus Sumerlaeota bacterium]